MLLGLLSPWSFLLWAVLWQCLLLKYTPLYPCGVHQKYTVCTSLTLHVLGHLMIFLLLMPALFIRKGMDFWSYSHNVAVFICRKNAVMRLTDIFWLFSLTSGFGCSSLYTQKHHHYKIPHRQILNYSWIAYTFWKLYHSPQNWDVLLDFNTEPTLRKQISYHMKAPKYNDSSASWSRDKIIWQEEENLQTKQKFSCWLEEWKGIYDKSSREAGLMHQVTVVPISRGNSKLPEAATFLFDGKTTSQLKQLSHFNVLFPHSSSS